MEDHMGGEGAGGFGGNGGKEGGLDNGVGGNAGVFRAFRLNKCSCSSIVLESRFSLRVIQNSRCAGRSKGKN